MFGFGKPKEKPLAEFTPPKAMKINYHVEVYHDRIVLKQAYKQPSTIYREDITGISTQSHSAGTTAIIIYGHGTVLYESSVPAIWAEPSVQFLRQFIKPPAQTQQSSEIDQLPKLKEMMEAGIITPEEFEAAKKKILGI